MDREFRILLIDDSTADARIIERALRESGRPCRLTVVADGRLALDYLRDLSHAAEPPPDLVLLDLNLPGIDGHEVLAQIRADPALRPLPVVVLTTSRREEDVWRTYQAGASTYIQKPTEYPRYRELASLLLSYWADLAVGPPPSPPG